MAGMAVIPISSGTPVTSQIAWQAWNQLYVTTSATASTTVIPAHPTWTSWNQQYNAGTLGVSFWGGTTAGTSANVGDGNQIWYSWNLAYQETEDQRLAREATEVRLRAEWEAGRAERERAAAAQAERRAKAADRALELLESCLTLDQWRSYREHGYFEVTSNRGRRWRIRSGSQSGNVDLMGEDNVREATLCFHPPGMLPSADAHLAQKLALETDEDNVLRIANYPHIRPGRTREGLRAA